MCHCLTLSEDHNLMIIIIIMLMNTMLHCYVRQHLRLNIQVLWEVILCRWVNGSRRSERPWYLNLHGVKQSRCKVGHHHLVLWLSIRIPITAPPLACHGWTSAQSKRNLWQNVKRTGSSPTTLVFACQYHSRNSPILISVYYYYYYYTDVCTNK